jgi:HlyD family secretion protein
LLPGMTANASIVIERQDNVLRLPNTALRFRPSDPAIAARGQALTGSGQRGDAGAQGGPGQRGSGGQGGGRGQRMVQQMAQQLELTPAQQATLQQAIQSAMQNAPPPGADASQTDRRAAMRQARQAALAALTPTLSARQRQLLQQMQQSGGERREVRNQAVVWVLRGNTPTPVQVTTGLADDSHTLLYTGLNAGDLVIIGGGPPAAAQQRNASPFGGPRGPGGGNVRVRGG